MVKTNQVVVIAAIVMVVSVGVGYMFGTSYAPTTPTQPAAKKATKESGVEVGLDNKVVKFISKSVSGTVKKASGQTITLEENGDTLSFKVAADARLTRLSIPSPEAPPSPEATPGAEPITPEESPTVPELPEPIREEISLNQVKVGDQVDALLYSQEDGTYLAREVTVSVEAQ